MFSGPLISRVLYVQDTVFFRGLCSQIPWMFLGFLGCFPSSVFPVPLVSMVLFFQTPLVPVSYVPMVLFPGSYVPTTFNFHFFHDLLYFPESTDQPSHYPIFPGSMFPAPLTPRLLCFQTSMFPWPVFSWWLCLMFLEIYVPRIPLTVQTVIINCFVCHEKKKKKSIYNYASVLIAVLSTHFVSLASSCFPSVFSSQSVSWICVVRRREAVMDMECDGGIVAARMFAVMRVNWTCGRALNSLFRTWNHSDSRKSLV